VAKVERSGMELSPPEDNTISELARNPFPIPSSSSLSALDIAGE